MTDDVLRGDSADQLKVTTGRRITMPNLFPTGVVMAVSFICLDDAEKLDLWTSDI
jgi:hypothetical protein